MIKLKNITKKYGETPIIDNVSLDIPKGQVIAFIGANGAGKSTLISIISRTLSKNSGEVYIDDKELSKWNNNELSKKISILKQSNNLNIRLTVKELVSFGRFPYSKGKLTKEDKQHINDAIKYMGIEDLQDRYLDELSGGQRQMAFISMIIAQDTEYVFLDEPLNNLDMHHCVKIMKNIKRLSREKNKTIIIVIHDINFVSLYADYIIAMKNGQIVKNSKKDEIIKEPVLKEIYGMDIKVKNIDGENICLYYS
ncbi:ATP-binding cassette domain-containing protein [uncultured Tyzzerella sp.]|uniref:iron ABC transporter ATP-binding protein n=1 Tax=uncultured Tyzzerella sp. TaxID=2321398 RepID=UPI002943B942|nr:ATP-binding cassette domain-containing protein [uncultured Tyzzerella sp.]